MAERLRDTNITVNALHPGAIDTKLLRSSYGAGGAPLIEGAKTLIYAALEETLVGISGKYFENNHPKSSKKITYNKTIQEKLWNKSQTLLLNYL